MVSKVCSRSQGQPSGARRRAMMETSFSNFSPAEESKRQVSTRPLPDSIHWIYDRAESFPCSSSLRATAAAQTLCAPTPAYSVCDIVFELDAKGNGGASESLPDSEYSGRDPVAATPHVAARPHSGMAEIGW